MMIRKVAKPTRTARRTGANPHAVSVHHLPLQNIPLTASGA